MSWRKKIAQIMTTTSCNESMAGRLLKTCNFDINRVFDAYYEKYEHGQDKEFKQKIDNMSDLDLDEDREEDSDTEDSEEETDEVQVIIDDNNVTDANSNDQKMRDVNYNDGNELAPLGVDKLPYPVIKYNAAITNTFLRALGTYDAKAANKFIETFKPTAGISHEKLREFVAFENFGDSDSFVLVVRKNRDYSNAFETFSLKEAPTKLNELQQSLSSTGKVLGFGTFSIVLVAACNGLYNAKHFAPIDTSADRLQTAQTVKVLAHEIGAMLFSSPLDFDKFEHIAVVCVNFFQTFPLLRFLQSNGDLIKEIEKDYRADSNSVILGVNDQNDQTMKMFPQSQHSVTDGSDFFGISRSNLKDLASERVEDLNACLESVGSQPMDLHLRSYGVKDLLSEHGRACFKLFSYHPAATLYSHGTAFDPVRWYQTLCHETYSGIKKYEPVKRIGDRRCSATPLTTDVNLCIAGMEILLAYDDFTDDDQKQKFGLTEIQKTIVREKVLDFLGNKHTVTGIFEPCRTGKTRISLAILAILWDYLPPGNILIVSPVTAFALNNEYKAWIDFFSDITRKKSSKTESTKAEKSQRIVQCITLVKLEETISNSTRMKTRYQLVLIDEAHEMWTKSQQKKTNNYVDLLCEAGDSFAPYIILITGTPIASTGIPDLFYLARMLRFDLSAFSGADDFATTYGNPIHQVTLKDSDLIVVGKAERLDCAKELFSMLEEDLLRHIRRKQSPMQVERIFQITFSKEEFFKNGFTYPSVLEKLHDELNLEQNENEDEQMRVLEEVKLQADQRRFLFPLRQHSDDELEGSYDADDNDDSESGGTDDNNDSEIDNHQATYTNNKDLLERGMMEIMGHCDSNFEQSNLFQNFAVELCQRFMNISPLMAYYWVHHSSSSIRSEQQPVPVANNDDVDAVATTSTAVNSFWLASLSLLQKHDDVVEDANLRRIPDGMMPIFNVIKESVENGKKVVIVCEYVGVLAYFSKLLVENIAALRESSDSVVQLDSKTAPTALVRKRMLENFNNPLSRTKVFFCSHVVCTGVDLNGAGILLKIDCGWQFCHEDQVCYRLSKGEGDTLENDPMELDGGDTLRNDDKKVITWLGSLNAFIRFCRGEHVATIANFLGFGRGLNNKADWNLAHSNVFIANVALGKMKDVSNYDQLRKYVINLLEKAREELCPAEEDNLTGGGGEETRISIIEERGMITMTFNSDDILRKVLSRAEPCIESMSLDVKKLVPQSLPQQFGQRKRARSGKGNDTTDDGSFQMPSDYANDMSMKLSQMKRLSPKMVELVKKSRMIILDRSKSETDENRQQKLQDLRNRTRDSIENEIRNADYSITLDEVIKSMEMEKGDKSKSDLKVLRYIESGLEFEKENADDALIFDTRSEVGDKMKTYYASASRHSCLQDNMFNVGDSGSTPDMIKDDTIDQYWESVSLHLLLQSTGLKVITGLREKSVFGEKWNVFASLDTILYSEKDKRIILVEIRSAVRSRDGVLDPNRQAMEGGKRQLLYAMEIMNIERGILCDFGFDDSSERATLGYTYYSSAESIVSISSRANRKSIFNLGQEPSVWVKRWHEISICKFKETVVQMNRKRKLLDDFQKNNNSK